MRSFLDKIIWIGLFLLFIPTTLVIASWNSLPGDFIYPVKLSLERSLLVLVSPSYEVSGQLQMKYTERRFADARRLLADKNSVTGLPYLDKQVEEAKIAIENAPNPEARQALVDQYIVILSQVFDGLQQQKMSLTQVPPSTFSVQGQPGSTSPKIPVSNESLQASPTSEVIPSPAAIAAQPTVITASPVNSITPTPASQPTLTSIISTTGPVLPPPPNIVVAMHITESQQKINDTIDDLKKSKSPGQQNKPQQNNPTQNPKKSDSHESTPTPESQ